MKISVKNDKKLRKLTCKIKILKIFKKNKTIKINTIGNINEKSAYEIETIEKAFNIKDKRQRNDYIYDRIYEYIKKNYVETNFCEFENGACIMERAKNNKPCNGCCGHCDYLIENNCSVKSLSCKFYYCPYMRKNKKPIKISHISSINCYWNIRQKIMVHYNLFQPKDILLRDINNNSLIMWAYYLIKRIINWTKNKKIS